MIEQSRKQADRFLTLIAEEEDVTFQTFDDKDKKRRDLSSIRHGSLDDHWEDLMELNRRGAGIFVTVNATDLQGRKADNITRVRAFFLDLDGAPLEPIYKAALRPHLIIESSPDRYHVYWIVEGAGLAQFKPVQAALAARFGGDKTVGDLPQVMRLPGFAHRKGEPFISRIRDENVYQQWLDSQKQRDLSAKGVCSRRHPLNQLRPLVFRVVDLKLTR